MTLGLFKINATCQPVIWESVFENWTHAECDDIRLEKYQNSHTIGQKLIQELRHRIDFATALHQILRMDYSSLPFAEMFLYAPYIWNKCQDCEIGDL